MQIKYSKFGRFFAVLLLVQSFMPYAVEGKGKKAAVDGMALSGLAGVALGHSLANYQAHKQQQNELQEQPQIPNGCYVQKMREQDPQDPTKYVYIGRLVCPTAAAPEPMPGQVQYAPTNSVQYQQQQQQQGAFSQYPANLQQQQQNFYVPQYQQHQQQQQYPYPQYIHPVEQRNDAFGQFQQPNQQQLNEQHHYLGDRPLPSSADTAEAPQKNETEFLYPVEQRNDGFGQYGPAVSQQQLNEQNHYLGDRPLPSSAVLPPHPHGQPLSPDTVEVPQQNHSDFLDRIEQRNDGFGQYGPEVSQQQLNEQQHFLGDRPIPTSGVVPPSQEQLNEQNHYLGDRPIPSSAVLPPHSHGQPLSPKTMKVEQQNHTEFLDRVEQRNDGFGQYGPEVSQQQLDEQQHFLGDRPIPSSGVVPPSQKQLNEQNHYLGDRPIPSSAVLPPHPDGQPLSPDAVEVPQQNQSDFLYPVKQRNGEFGQSDYEQPHQQQLDEQHHYLGDGQTPYPAILPPYQAGLPPQTVNQQFPGYQQHPVQYGRYPQVPYSPVHPDQSHFPIPQHSNPSDGAQYPAESVQTQYQQPAEEPQFPTIEEETTKRPGRIHSYLDKFNEIRKAKGAQLKERLSTLILKNKASNDEVSTDPATRSIEPSQNGTHFQSNEPNQNDTHFHSNEPVKPVQGSDNKKKGGKSSSDKVWPSNILLILPLVFLLISLQ